jgi:hypothetical protein
VVQQISALIVRSELDAGKYTAGANQKVAADREMAASSRTVAVAIDDTSGKISVAGDALARLSRRYIEGRADEQNFVQGLNQLGRALETGKVSMEGAERILVGMNQRLGLTADAAQLAAKGQNELATAVTRANAQIERQATELEEAAAASKRLQAANSNVISHGARQAAGFNAGQQLQDVAMMSILGQDPRTIALQQGPQLATAMQQGGGLAALGSGLASLFSVTTLLTVGFTAATAATIQWFMKGKDGAKSFTEALKAHSDALRLLKEDYGQLGEVAKNAVGIAGVAFTDASARSAQALIAAQLRTKATPFLDKMSGTDGLSGYLFGSGPDAEGLRNLSGDQTKFAAPVAALLDEVRKGNSQGGLEKFRKDVEALYETLVGKSGAPTALRATADAVELLGESAFTVSGKFAPFADQINRLKVEGAAGLATFNAEVEKIGRATGLQKVADEAIVAGKEVVALAQKAADLEKIIRRLEAGKRGPLIGSSAETDRNNYLDAQRLTIRSTQRAFDADMAALGAKSPQELAAAARARESARDVDGESAEVRNQRIDLAGKRALLEAEHSLKEARDQRTRSIAASLDQQQHELGLIGKTSGEQAKLRYEFERMQELREQAARTGTPIDEKEVANIKAAAEAMGSYADALARAKLGDDLSFESDQLRRTAQDQQIAARLRGAGLPVDLNGQFAQQMRDNQRYSDARDVSSGFVKTLGSELISSGGKIGKSMGNALESSLLNAAQKAWEKLADQLGIAVANWLTGGGGASTGGGAGAFGTASGFADLLFGKGAANDNYAPGAITRAPLPAIGSGSRYSVAGATDFIKQYSSAIGIDPDIALRVARSEGLGKGIWQSNAFSNGNREPSFGPFQLLKGGKGTGFGTGLGNKFMAQTGLDPADPANWQQSTAFALDQAKANGWGAWYGAKGQGITGFMGIDQSASKAVGALDKLTTSSVDTATSLSSGLGKLGSSLNQFPAAPGASGGGGGLFSWLGGLLGGGVPQTSFASEILSGARVGLFADGTEGAPPGWAWVGERGPELRRLRAGDVIRSNQRSMQMVADNANGGGMPAFSPVFQIDARGSTMSRGEYEQIARQQSEAALANYHKNQVRGGFGSTQKRFASQKG